MDTEVRKRKPEVSDEVENKENIVRSGSATEANIPEQHVWNNNMNGININGSPVKRTPKNSSCGKVPINRSKIFNIYYNLRRFKGRNMLYFGKSSNAASTSQLFCFCRMYPLRNHRHHYSKDDLDSEDDKNIDLSKTIPSGTNKMPVILEQALNGLSDRWRNWTIRVISTILLTITFLLIIYGGPLALMVATLVVQVKCFEEIINIGYAVYRIHGLPWFRSLSWYFLITSNYFFYGESLVDYFGVVINQTDYLKVLVKYHRFISFSLYCIGFVWFVLSLVHKYYMKQFSLFAWTHVALLIVVTQSYLIIQNIFEGLIWFIVPVTMIIMNDVWAYVFGFFFGRTPLIKVSPKKTWEGFIGGGIATVIFGLIISYFLCHFQYFVCPIEYSEYIGKMTMDCEPSYLFRPQEYSLPNFLASPLHMLKLKSTVTVYPFVLHSFSMAIFSSVIGPFGGFFASGFKRAFKIKDFGDVIPGHGGIMDRFDCQFLMATFVNVYISSFIRSPSPQKLLQQVFNLKPEHQLQLFYALKDALINRGILGAAEN